MAYPLYQLPAGGTSHRIYGCSICKSEHSMQMTLTCCEDTFQKFVLFHQEKIGNMTSWFLFNANILGHPPLSLGGQHFPCPQ